jgi:undecaprenyl-diphosphatase
VLDRLDCWVDTRFEGARRSRAMVELMVYFSNLGTYSLIWLGVGLIGLATLPPQQRLMIAFLVAVPAEYILTNGLVKSIFRRRRPLDPLQCEWTAQLKGPRTSSFPSGHSSAAALAVAALVPVGLLGGVAAFLAAGIVLSRLFLRLHHFTDVVGGLVWGALLGLLIRDLAGVG